MHYALSYEKSPQNFVSSPPKMENLMTPDQTQQGARLVNTSCSFRRWLPVFRQFSYRILCSTQQGRGCSCEYSRVGLILQTKWEMFREQKSWPKLGVLHNRKLAPAALYMDSQPQHCKYCTGGKRFGCARYTRSSRHLLPIGFFEAQTGSSTRKAESCGDGKRTLSNWHQQGRFANVTCTRISDHKRILMTWKGKYHLHASHDSTSMCLQSLTKVCLLTYPLPLQIPLYKRCKYIFAATVYQYISISV